MAPVSTGPDLSPLKIDDRARNSGGGRRWLRWLAAALGAALLVSALVLALQRKTLDIASARFKAGTLCLEVFAANRV